MTAKHRSRSPLRERERSTSPQRREEVDYGQDADDHVRHIARTKKLTTPIGEKRTIRGWPWVLRALVHRRSEYGHGCPVDLLDTILYGVDDGPKAVFYTEGKAVARKKIGEGEGSIPLARAAKHLYLPKRYYAVRLPAEGANVAVAFTTTGEATAMKTSDVDKIRAGQATPPLGTETLVLLVPTKGTCAELLLGLQHTFTLEPGSAKPVHLSYRLAVVKGVSKRVLCKSSILNQFLLRACSDIVQWIEACSGARVLRLVLEFVEDVLGKLWLVRSSECVTSQTVLLYRRQRRSPSPVQSKATRHETAKGVANELSLLRYGYGIGQEPPAPSDASIHADRSNWRGGPPVSPESCQRPRTALPQAEVTEKRRAAESETERNAERHFRARCLVVKQPKAIAGRMQRGTRQEEEEGEKVGGNEFKGFAAPGENDPRLVGRTAAAGRALGSSQLDGLCQGDFCEVDLLDKIEQRTRFERGEAGSGSLARIMSEGRDRSSAEPGDEVDRSAAFRKRLMQLDETTLEDHGILQPETSTTEENSRKALVGGDQGPGSRLKAAACGKRREVGDDQRRGSDSPGAWSEIPFSWIVRGRQERHLIDQQLRRYRRGSQEPFVLHLSSLGESSVSLGAVFPATYYQPVRVCRNCYRVYSMVDAARKRSVSRLDACAAAEATGTRSIGDGRELPRAKRARLLEQEVQLRDSSCAESTKTSNTSLAADESVTLSPKDESEGTGSASMETLALMRAQAAIDGFTRGDICELRSFSKPPAPVNMVVAAMMIALTGDGEPSAAGWFAAKRFMMNLDKVSAAIAGLNLDTLRPSQVRRLEDYARNPAFRPEIIACVSLPASRLCAWILGILEARRWRTGRGHPQIDLLGGWSTQEEGRKGLVEAEPSAHRGPSGTSAAHPLSIPGGTVPGVTGRGHLPIICASGSRTQSNIVSRDSSALGPTILPFRPSTIDNASASARARSQRWQSQPPPASRRAVTWSRKVERLALPDAWATAEAGLSPPYTEIGPDVRVGSAPNLDVPALSTHTNDDLQHPDTRIARSGVKEDRGRKRARAARVAVRGRQSRTTERLADATAAPPDPAGFEQSEFRCSDGVTLIPFAVAGKLEEGASSPVDDMGDGAGTARDENRDRDEECAKHARGREVTPLGFVAVHDFFDTLEKTFLLFKPLILRHPGCQVLFFNIPGQAGTSLPPHLDKVLTHDWVADRMHELMQHVDNMGHMPLSDRPFHLLGIGNGGSIAAAFACKYAAHPRWKPTLRTLTCVNGFATVDTQLAAVLHSAQGAFRCFPPDRPDLPITFWSRFIFSDEYVKRVGSDLALNIFSAVANPLAVEGMLRIIRGTLGSRDMRRDLPSIALPLILIQSTDNLLVNAANVDPFLEGRRPRHLWSHQLRIDQPPGFGTAPGEAALTYRRDNPRAGQNERKMSVSPPPPRQAGNAEAPKNKAGADGLGRTCLGSAGERALFESISAGHDGAFVVWVRAGHEIRQECKRVLTDVLELLITPRCQAEAFFRRGPCPRGAPRERHERIGIASRWGESWGPKTGTGAPEDEASLERSDYPGRPGTVEASTPWREGDEPRDGKTSSGEGQQDGGGAGHGSKGALDDGSAGEDLSPVDGRRKRQEGGKMETSKYGYASLRKIHRLEPYPELPRRSEIRGISSSHESRKTRSPVGWVKPKTTPEPDSKNVIDRPSWAKPSIRCPSPRSPSPRNHLTTSPSPRPEDVLEIGAGIEKDDPPEPSWRDGVHMEVAPLEQTVAEFDQALREHRARRGQRSGLSSGTPRGGVVPLDPFEGLEAGERSGGDSSSRPGERGTTGIPQPRASHQSYQEEKKHEVDGEREVSAEMILFKGIPELLQQGEPIISSRKTGMGSCHGVDGPVPPAGVGDTGDESDAPATADGTEPDQDTAQPAVESRRFAGFDAQHPAGLTGHDASPVASRDPKTSNAIADAICYGAPSEVGSKGMESFDSPGAPGDVESSLQNREPRGSSGSRTVAREGHGADDPSSATVSFSPRSHGESEDLMAESARKANLGQGSGRERLPLEAMSPGKGVEKEDFGVDPTNSEMEDAGVDDDIVRIMGPTVARAITETADPISTAAQRTRRDWMEGTQSGRAPPPLTVAEAEAELVEKITRLRSRRQASEREAYEAVEGEGLRRIAEDQATRAAAFSEEDRRMLEGEERRLADLRLHADVGRLQRGAEFEEIDHALVEAGAATPDESALPAATRPVPVRGMRPQHYGEPDELPEGLKRAIEHQPAEKVLDDLESLAARARVAGCKSNVEELERMEQRQLTRQVERLEILHGQADGEKQEILRRMAVRMQCMVRITLARSRTARLQAADLFTKTKTAAAVKIQALVRARSSFKRVQRMRKDALDDVVLGSEATRIQKLYRGRLGRGQYLVRLREQQCRVLQRAVRGFLGRRVAKRKRAMLARYAARASSATKIQSTWRGKAARIAYLRDRCSWLASREIQRVYRGHLGRRKARRREEWQTAGPGAERLKLGLRMIEDTKVAFEKQQSEIAALDRAQEKAEARVSHIHHQLKTSEAELGVLEGEMAQVDHLERELIQLTHERDLLTRGITGAAGLRKTMGAGEGGDKNGGEGGEGGRGDSSGCHDESSTVGAMKAEAYALEMQIQLKRAEREQCRQQLSTEFASTFADVADKKRQLERLSTAVADIEATRQRKSKEFSHMQRNLMELLAEQKRELDLLREKGVQLETAAATSAAAAAATAQRARDHEAKAAAMYEQTEELMKFQFMSMSLSYFSSLNMMKQMRDINADTTTAAITSTADAAAAAAASAAAASIPSLKNAEHLGGDIVSRALAKRREEVESTRREIEEAEESQRHPFPAELALWTVDDVSRWLDTLQLGEYKKAFQEGKVDGSFLAELREADLVDSIGMVHKLHLRKLLLARKKLLPLTEEEKAKAKVVRREDAATAIREGIPDIETVFSQARHGKKKRLEETLNKGFKLETEDEHGNTLLIVAVQQLQTPVVEFLVQRGANVNHSNAAGNTPLHFAMLYDTSGQTGEYLINNGADDSIENNNGCSPYDGI